MNKIRVLISWCMVLLIAGLSGCNNDITSNKEGTSDKTNYYTDIGEWKVPKLLLAGSKKQHIARPSVKLINNKKAVLYSTKGKILLSLNNKEYIVDSKEGTTKLWLFTDSNNNIFTFWWKKKRDGTKRLFFRGSSNLGKTFSDKVTVNTGGGVLKQLQFYSDGNGNIVVAYYDERNPSYRIYANSSSDNGKTWKKKDDRLDNDENAVMHIKKGKSVPHDFALNPMLGYLDSGKIIVSWQQKKVINNKVRSQIASRISNDFGKTWEPEQTVFTWEGQHIVEANMAVKGNKVVITAGYPKKGLLGFYGIDTMASEGINWQELGGVAGTQNVNEISWIRPVMSEDVLKVGYILQKEQNTKYHVHVASMKLAEAKWEEKPFRVDLNTGQPVETKSQYFDIQVLPSGEFVVAWEDYRSLIPMLMLNQTSGKGTKWLDKPLKLTRGGLSHIKFPEFMIGSNKAILTFEWDIINDAKLPRLSYMEFPINPGTGQLVVNEAPQGKQYSKAELKEKLKKRVEAFMDHRVKKEWEKSWPFMDPVYRLVTPKSKWLRNMGYVTFEKYDIKNISVEGRFATVNIDMMISLPQQVRSNELIEATPAKLNSTTTKWLWFYDDWYFFSDGEFFRYLKF